jgi:metal-sulfur cluster biosynthetic enzyme
MDRELLIFAPIWAALRTVFSPEVNSDLIQV